MTDADQKDPSSNIPEGGQQSPAAEIVDLNPPQPLAAATGVDPQVPAAETQQPAASPIAAYAAIAVVLGILGGVAVAFISLRPTGQTSAHQMNGLRQTRDFGFVDAGSVGLKGHLTTNWDQKLGYRLVVEPSDPMLRAGFALAVSQPPRPLSALIQLKDSAGIALCSQYIALKYDPANGVVPASSQPGGEPGNSMASKTAGDQETSAAGLDRLKALELERERGMDIFQNDIGQDGQIVSISSQGGLPCSLHAYGSTASWSFQPDFPTLAEQVELVKSQPDTKTSAASSSQKKSSPRRKSKPAAVGLFPPFSIEGDESIAAFDPSSGILETREGRTYIVDKTGIDANLSRWQDFPAHFHYRCDQSAACTLSRIGGVVLHARLKK